MHFFLLPTDSDYDTIPVGKIIAADQKWYNHDDNVVLKIDKVNNETSTFAGTYGIIRNDETAEFPFRGEFDPQGITVGWVVSYWNEYENDHALGAWAGYLGFAAGRILRWTISTTRIIAHEDSYNTTTGRDIFILE